MRAGRPACTLRPGKVAGLLYISRCSPLAGGSAMMEVLALRYPQRSLQCQRYKDALIHGILPAALCGGQDAPKHRNCRRLRRQQCVRPCRTPLVRQAKGASSLPHAPYAAASGRRATACRFPDSPSGNRGTDGDAPAPRRRNRPAATIGKWWHPSTVPTKPARLHPSEMGCPDAVTAASGTAYLRSWAQRLTQRLAAA